MMSSTGETEKAVFVGPVDNNQLSDAEKQALLENAVHEARWVDQDGKKRLTCVGCTKTFSDRGHLRTHYNIVHLKTMYKCTVAGCEEWFNSMRARQRHIQKVHTPIQPGSQLGNAVASPMRTVAQPIQQPVTVSSPYHQQVVQTSTAPQTIRHQQPIIQQQQQHVIQQQTVVQQAPQQTIIQAQPQTTVQQQQQIIQQQTIQAPVVQVQQQPVQQVQHQIIQQQSSQQQQHVYQTQQVISQPTQQQHVIHQQQYFQQQQSQPLPQMQAIQQHVIHPQQATVIQAIPQQQTQTHQVQQQAQHVVSAVSTAVVTQAQTHGSTQQTQQVQLPSMQQSTNVTMAQPFIQTSVYQGSTNLQPAQAVVMSTAAATSLQSQQPTQQVVITQQPSQTLAQSMASQQSITQVQVIGNTGYAVASQPNPCNHIQQQQQQQVQTPQTIQQQPVIQQQQTAIQQQQTTIQQQQATIQQQQTTIQQQPTIQKQQQTMQQQQTIHQHAHQHQQSVNVVQQQSVEVAKLCPEHKQIHQQHVHVQQQQQIQIQQQPQQSQVQTQAVILGHQCATNQHPQQHTYVTSVPVSSKQVNNEQTVKTISNVSVVGANFGQASTQQNKLIQPATASQLQRRSYQQTDVQHQQHHVAMTVTNAQTQQQQQPLPHLNQQTVTTSSTLVQHEQSCLQNQKTFSYHPSPNQAIQAVSRQATNGNVVDIVSRQAAKRTVDRDQTDGDAPPAKLPSVDQISASADSGLASQEQDSGLDEDEFDSESQDQKTKDAVVTKQVNDALTAFIRRLQDIDVNGYFAFPMTELTHPGCTTQLDRHSDLYTMKKQIQLGRYHSAQGLQMMREELDLIFTNAMKYYNEKSSEYRLAARLWKVADDGVVTLTSDLTNNFPQVFAPSEETVATEELISDGKSTLGFLQPDNRGCVGKKHRVRTIGEEVGRPVNCVGPQPPLRDDRRNKIIPISYLDYGSFSSFAPTYDSGAAYCTKEDSDLVLGEFGLFAQSDSAEMQQRSRQRQELVDETALIVPEPELGDDFSLYLLNAFTKDILKEERDTQLTESDTAMLAEDILASGQLPDEVNEMPSRTAAGTIIENGLPDNKEVKPEFITTIKKEEGPQRMLEENASTLGKLREANFARLQQPHNRLAQVPAVEEQALADRVVASLAVMVGCNKPDDVVSNSALHRSMNVDLGVGSSDVTPAQNPVACGEA